ncbi:hypothetical protein [Dactylosporangium sp. NPDC048998]|uniref:hypothetical protein n=1 Tax=Dactylosporangium sp. NPDC048998 TaxID=3363976 RepID=UPI00371D3CBD
MSVNDVVEVRVPVQIDSIVDLAPVANDRTWLVLDQTGRIGRWNIQTGAYEHLAHSTVPNEEGRAPWNGRSVRRRLHTCVDATFAAVVNDYARFGEVIDLRSGRVTMTLDNHGYHEETVPFSLAFTRHVGQIVVIHRTEWNRLDASIAATGQSLTDRSPTFHGQDEPRPEHYLDYFHGALYLSPDGQRILDDGWIWHPVGFPAVWSVERWLTDNVWESEDGPSRTDVCGREYYWDQAMTWIDSVRVAVEGVGDDADDIQPGARIFDTTRLGSGGQWRLPTAVELGSFPAATGRFFSDGIHLFTSDAVGLHIWNLADGTRLTTLHGFSPTHHHRSGRQLLQLADTTVRIWTY